MSSSQSANSQDNGIVTFGPNNGGNAVVWIAGAVVVGLLIFFYFKRK